MQDGFKLVEFKVVHVQSGGQDAVITDGCAAPIYGSKRDIHGEAVKVLTVVGMHTVLSSQTCVFVCLLVCSVGWLFADLRVCLVV